MNPRTSSQLSWRPSPSATFIGIDGAKGGWVVASLKDGDVILELAPSIHDVTFPKLHRALIDMPIGLPDSSRRACDAQARARLGTRRSTLFSVPTRTAIYAATYHDACEANAKLQNIKLSKQVWNITAKIKEIDAFLRRTPAMHNSLAEGHPELAFLTLSKDGKDLSPKKTTEGLKQRRAILKRHLPASFWRIAETFRARHAREVDMSDILDALALATLLLRSAGEAHFLGSGDLDSHGIPCRICYR